MRTAFCPWRQFAVAIAVALLASPVVAASPLQDAVEAKDLSKVRELLAAGADPNELGIQGSPLNLAARNGSVEVATALIDAGVDLETPGLAGTHPLHSAATVGDTTMAKLLISRGAKVDSLDNTGRTPLLAAALAPDEAKDAAMLKVLLAAGANPQQQDTAHHMTALHFAGAKGKIQVAEVLLAAGVDINLRDGQGDTALHHAVGDGQFDMVQYLIVKGADVNIANNDGETPLRFASDGSEIRALLIKSGASQ